MFGPGMLDYRSPHHSCVKALRATIMWMEGKQDHITQLGRLSGRKQRLLACACVRRAERMLPDPALLSAIEAAEAFADGGMGLGELEAVYHAASAVSAGLPEHSPECLAAWAATRTTTHPQYCNRPFDGQETRHLSQIVTEALFPGRNPFDQRVADVRQVEADAHQRLLEDIGQLAVAFNPSWRTEAVVGLARGMYESRDFAPMPVLADALEDAGCDQPDILAHCRGDRPHVRGCWVVDLVLGKE